MIHVAGGYISVNNYDLPRLNVNLIVAPSILLSSSYQFSIYLPAITT